jgi:DMSO/TMAO reductase YedYZ heme-binding membrane subunit
MVAVSIITWQRKILTSSTTKYSIKILQSTLLVRIRKPSRKLRRRKSKENPRARKQRKLPR